MSEHRYDIDISNAALIRIRKWSRQDPDNFTRFQTRERCALEIAAYVFYSSSIYIMFTFCVMYTFLSNSDKRENFLTSNLHNIRRNLFIGYCMAFPDILFSSKAVVFFLFNARFSIWAFDMRDCVYAAEKYNFG